MNSIATQYIKKTNVDHYNKNPEGFLKWIVEKLPNDKVVMGTGFGPPGIVLLDMLFKVTNNISVFYIDTSFLFEQTYDLKKKLEETDAELLEMAIIELSQRFQSDAKEYIVPFEMELEIPGVKITVPQRGDRSTLPDEGGASGASDNDPSIEKR